MPKRMDFVSKLSRLSEGLDFSQFACTPLGQPLSLGLYKDWLKAGHHASMDYLERHLAVKENPELLLPKAASAIVVTKNYHPHPYASDEVLSARTALYARGLDYHSQFQEELEKLRGRLEAEYPDEKFLCFTDSAPVLERDLAVRAGLGWIGKNGCVIHPQQGSLFLLGEIFTTLALGSPAPAHVPDMCGTCDRCLTACPTQALVAPRVLDARKCISYWTIEARAPAPLDLREKFADWFFGCDICQTVCPWNEKVFGRELMRSESLPSPTTELLVLDLRSILTATPAQLRARFAELPYSRARALGLKRNALYVAGNLRLGDLRPDIEAHLENLDLKELSEWALARLN